MEMHAWTNLTADGNVRALLYSFGLGTANTFAARLDDGAWLVVSPATGAPRAALEALERDGGVSALVAPNAFHHMGQAEWREVFPKAQSFAPEGAIRRLAKQARGIPFEALEPWAAQLPQRVRLWVPDGMKAPDLVASVASGSESAWFGGDLVSNTVAGDIKPIPRFIFGLLGGGEGYRFNKVPAMVYLRDREAWKASMRARVDADPPTVMLPAHGRPLRDDVAAKTRAILG